MNFIHETSANSTTQSLKLMDYLEISMYSINLFFGFPTHSYVLWLIVTGTSGITSEFFNLNLCVCEFGICLNSLAFVISMWFSSLLKFEEFFVGFSAAARPLFQCLMCVERYLAVVHPVTFLKYKPLRYRLICCAVVWMMTLGACVFCMVYVEWQNANGFAWLLPVQMFLFLFIQLFCLVAVLRALKQSGPGDRKREKEENHMKRRAFQIIIITTVNTVLMYAPKAITGFYETVIGQKTQPNMFPALTCFTLAGFLHPVLYLHRNGKLSCSCMT